MRGRGWGVQIVHKHIKIMSCCNINGFDRSWKKKKVSGGITTPYNNRMIKTNMKASVIVSIISSAEKRITFQNYE